MKKLIAVLILALAAVNAFADTIYVQSAPQICQWQNVLNPQTGMIAPAMVCQQYIPPPTVIYSSPPTQTIIVEHENHVPWYVPFAAGAGAALILRGGEGHHHHR